jgi:hypothetical protein
MGMRRSMQAALAATVGAVAVVGTAGAAVSAAPFSVSSTLAGTNVLPHRIHWVARPSLPASKIREVDFLIDGRLSWVEHHAPYTYGYDGNYLVTTWMSPGMHSFTVTAIATDRSRATTSSKARVQGPPPAPPSALAGSWQRNVSKAQAGGSGRPGMWTLEVDKVGWRILDPSRHGALVDVAYLSAGVLEIRGGIATRNHDSHEGNVWCDEPFQPVRYHWAVSGDTLTLALVGPKRCDGQSDVMVGDWSHR